MIQAILGVIWLKYLLWILWLVLFIWALVDILKQPRGGGWKIIWILVCLVFPVVGVIVYAILRKK